MAVLKRRMGWLGRPGTVATPFLLVAIICISGCHRSRPYLSPVPPEIKSVEGYASLSLTEEGTTAKSRFSFIFVLPAEGRIDVKNPLGRDIASLFIKEKGSYLVLPAKKMYWAADREEVMAKLLGFALSPQEMASLLTGELEDLGSWDVQRDGQNRIVQGRRNGLQFEVRQFFPDSRVPRLIAFVHAGASGSLKVLRLNFNQPLSQETFRLAFLDDKKYSVSTWAEIEKWLRHED